MKTLAEHLKTHPPSPETLGIWMSSYYLQSNMDWEEDIWEFARQIMDNLPALHEQSLDTLIRLATEKAHAAGMQIELMAESREATPEPNAENFEAPEYPIFAWYSRPPFQELLLNGVPFGTAWEDGMADVFGRIYHLDNQDDAKRFVEAEYRRWWRELLVLKEYQTYMFPPELRDAKSIERPTTFEARLDAIESKFRRWWDETHNLNSTTPNHNPK